MSAANSSKPPKKFINLFVTPNLDGVTIVEKSPACVGCLRRHLTSFAGLCLTAPGECQLLAPTSG